MPIVCTYVFHVTYRMNSNHSLNSLVTITAMQFFLVTQILSNCYKEFKSEDAIFQGL